MSGRQGRPRVWKPGTEHGDALWLAIQTHDNWEEITQYLNNRFNESISIRGVKSAAYRNSWSLENKTVVRTKRDRLNDLYGVESETDVPVIVIEDDREWVPIWHCADMHAGSTMFDEASFMAFREQMLKIRAKVFGLGDWAEVAVPTHMPQTVWSQTSNVRTQKDWLKRCFIPFDVKLIIPGNHEFRGINLTSDDILESVADECDAYYSKYSTPMIVKCGDVQYTMFCGHGQSVRKDQEWELREWAKIFPGCDTYALGHDHNLWSGPIMQHFDSPLTSMDWTDGGSTLKMEHKCPMGIRTGHWLKYSGYVRQKPYEPKRLGNPVVWLNQGTKKIIVDTYEFTDRN
jgi:hypothetical protein